MLYTYSIQLNVFSPLTVAYLNLSAFPPELFVGEVMTCTGMVDEQRIIDEHLLKRLLYFLHK